MHSGEAIDSFAGDIFRPSAGSLTPLRFRFIICSDLLERRILRIIEYDTLPQSENPYAALSYPWDGLQACSRRPANEFFRVQLEGLDGQFRVSALISIDVLRTACIAARRFGANLLWIDQLCIIQTDRADKNWQISRMFNLYSRCKVSLVFPGGLQRLAAHDESTPWIERSWTLQEAMPKWTYCVFGFPFPGGAISGLTTGTVREVEKGKSALIELGELTEASVVGFCTIGTHEIRFKVLGHARDPIMSLMAVKRARDDEMREMAVWRSALMRTCSQSRDMILSIMGIFGVTLDAGSYGMDDRERAAVDLAYEMLKRGRKPSWLGAAPACGNLARMPTMPSLPEVDGNEVFYCLAGSRQKPWNAMGSDLDWYVKGPVRAVMETRGSGRLNVTAKTLCIELGTSTSATNPFWSGFRFSTIMTLNEGEATGQSVSIDLSKSLPSGKCQAIVVGFIEHYMLNATAAKAGFGSALLMILSGNPRTRCWDKLAYGAIEDVDSVTRTWPTCVLVIGE